MSKRLGRFLTAVVNGVSAPQHYWRRAHTRLRVVEALIQRHEVVTPHGRLIFVSSNRKSLLSPQYHAGREPETLDWINRFDVPCIYWDIGANIGEFALYAALRAGVSVVAFEPSAANYAALCRNIEANRAPIQGFCLALSDRTQLGSLNLSDSEAGGYFNAFESEEDCFGRPLEVRFRQSMIGFTLDGFRRMFDLPPPNYLKIDVDGTEEQILAGAAATLADPALRSVLIEIEQADTPRNARIVARLEAAGFVLTGRGGDQRGSSNAIFVRAALSRTQ